MSVFILFVFLWKCLCPYNIGTFMEAGRFGDVKSANNDSLAIKIINLRKEDVSIDQVFVTTSFEVDFIFL